MAGTYSLKERYTVIDRSKITVTFCFIFSRVHPTKKVTESVRIERKIQVSSLSVGRVVRIHFCLAGIDYDPHCPMSIRPLAKMRAEGNNSRLIDVYPSLILLISFIYDWGLRKSTRSSLLTFPMVKLGLELDPMKTQSVEESREAFHQEQDGDGDDRPEAEYKSQNWTAQPSLR